MLLYNFWVSDCYKRHNNYLLKKCVSVIQPILCREVNILQLFRTRSKIKNRYFNGQVAFLALRWSREIYPSECGVSKFVLPSWAMQAGWVKCVFPRGCLFNLCIEAEDKSNYQEQPVCDAMKRTVARQYWQWNNTEYYSFKVYNIGV